MTDQQGRSSPVVSEPEWTLLRLIELRDGSCAWATWQRILRGLTDDVWLIQDTRSCSGNSAMFWGKNRCGYAADFNDVGFYTKAEAKSQERDRPTDHAVRLRDVVGALRITSRVDIAEFPGRQP